MEEKVLSSSGSDSRCACARSHRLGLVLRFGDNPGATHLSKEGPFVYAGSLEQHFSIHPGSVSKSGRWPSAHISLPPPKRTQLWALSNAVFQQSPGLRPLPEVLRQERCPGSTRNHLCGWRGSYPVFPVAITSCVKSG